MIEVRAPDIRGSAFRNGTEFLYTGLAPADWQMLKTFPESFRNHPRYCFPSLLRNGGCEAMGFRVFDVQSFHDPLRSIKEPTFLLFYNRSRKLKPALRTPSEGHALD
jgi:hypothetical protein